MTDIKWGEPLTGPEMKALNLPRDTPVRCINTQSASQFLNFMYHGPLYRLPADHPYYTVKRHNTEHGTHLVLWLGGENAPDDWDRGVLFRNGQASNLAPWCWRNTGYPGDIIGYIRKAEYGRVHTDGSRSGGQPVSTPDPDTVTIKRMTEAEAREHFPKTDAVLAMRILGLIREETREERFKKAVPNWHMLNPKLLAQAALEFERDD